MKGFRLIALLSMTLAAGRASADDAKRMTDETAKLFGLITSTAEPPGRCQYDISWSAVPVPHRIASQYLGSKVHADLLGPSNEILGGPRRFMDPTRRNEAAFCNERDWETYEKAESDKFNEQTKQDKINIRRMLVGFPVFDEHYEKAIVIIEEGGLYAFHGAKKMPGYGTVFAKIFIRSKEGWKLIKREVISIS